MTDSIVVYIAGASACDNVDAQRRVRAAMSALRKIDNTELAYDWLANMQRVGAPDHLIDTPALRAHGQVNAAHVERAHLVWLLQPRIGESTRMAWWELGIAHGLRIPLIVSAAYETQDILPGPRTLAAAQARLHFATDGEALRFIANSWQAIREGLPR